MGFSGLIDRDAIEAECAWEDRDVHKTLYSLLADTASKFPNRNAVSYQLFSGPKDHAETLSWQDLHDKSNIFT